MCPIKPYDLLQMLQNGYRTPLQRDLIAGPGSQDPEALGH